MLEKHPFTFTTSETVLIYQIITTKEKKDFKKSKIHTIYPVYTFPLLVKGITNKLGFFILAVKRTPFIKRKTTKPFLPILEKK